jgi:serine/threonine-protein kinase
VNDDADLEWIGRQVLGRYRVMRRLAHGGMGVVYLGRLEGAAGFSKPVVIKRIISDEGDQEGATARFIREAQILSNLQHPGIVGVLDFGEEDERYSMVLEYVNGYDLGRWLKYLQLKAQTMPWEEAVFITLRLLEALSYAHGFRRGDGSSAEILHRDISPGNVLLDLDGRVRLADFGIARMEASTGDQFKTQTGVLKGKVAYLAPELFSGSPPSRASDIYACAVILYQMLAGANPFAAHNDSRVMWRVIMEGPSPLARQRDDLPPGLEELIFAAIDRDLLRRHDDAESFAAELRRVLTRPEAEIQDALREHVRGDFNGDMPALLRLETLAERDRAWRPDLPSAEVTRNIVTSDPSSLVHSLTPATASEEPEPAAAYEPQLTVRTERRNAPAPADGVTVPQVTTKRAGPGLSPKMLVGLGLGMSVVIGLIVAGALLGLRQSSPPTGASRFIVVESPEQKRAPEIGSAVIPEPPPAPAPAPSVANAASDAPKPPKNTRPARRPAPDSSAALTQAFARRQGALTRCFEQHAREVEGRPEISVTFEVSPAGAVSSAGLAPASLEGTPLGRCLLDVARSTRFGAVGKVTRFSIPIRASAVQR